MSKKQQRKSLNKNNYKIEALGPRWMMDAYVDYDDFVDEITDYNYASALSSTLTEMQQNVEQPFTDADDFQTAITEQLQNFETADLSNLGLNGTQVEASALFNGIATDAMQKFNTLQNQIASQLNDPDAGLSGIVRQDGEIVSVDKATLLSVLAA